MYNHYMKKQRPLKKYSTVFLILGLAFLVVGIATDQTAFSWIAIAFVLVSLLTGGKWLDPENRLFLRLKNKLLE